MFFGAHAESQIDPQDLQAWFVKELSQNRKDSKYDPLSAFTGRHLSTQIDTIVTLTQQTRQDQSELGKIDPDESTISEAKISPNHSSTKSKKKHLAKKTDLICCHPAGPVLCALLCDTRCAPPSTSTSALSSTSSR